MADHPFVHLHTHSDYSLLDGAQKISAIVKKAVHLGMPAVAVTDHGALYGAMDLYHGATSAGIKPIIGIETYLTLAGRADRSTRDNYHVTLLAQNERGYRNLLALSSKAFTEGFYYKPRVDFDLLEAHADGIICLSGCLSGLIQRSLLNDDEHGARVWGTRFREIFGDRFYIEVMRHKLPDQERVEAATLDLARYLSVPIVATNDAHYLDANDHATHDMVLCVQTGKTVDDPKRLRFDSHEFYFKSGAQMNRLFSDLPEAITATIDIAQSCSLTLERSRFHIPAFTVPPKNGHERPPQQYLRTLCEAGLRKRYGDRVDTDSTLQTRLDNELAVIERMGFASYFLIVWDFVRWARDRDIPVGPGRGSVVGSLVAYCLRITDLDPLRFNLVFERFLNEHRVTMPDIDTDFCVERRNEVIDYVKARYGEDRVAQIVTFGTMQRKAALRDAGRALNVPLPIVDATVRAMENNEAPPHEPGVDAMIAAAARLEGLVRNAGTHAAGVVISDAPLDMYVPLARLDGAINTQYEMGWIEALGLIKMDFLGLRNLTIMDRAAKSIRERDPQFDLTTIPDDDAATYKTIARGDTTGIFQLESPGMRRMLREMKPDVIDDLVAAVALYRPGPMEWIPLYIQGKAGEREPSYIHPALEPILRETYGVPTYQEQIIHIAREIAGMSMSEADDLRRVVGKKHPEEMPKVRAQFIAGALKQGVTQDVAEAIFTFIEPFAGYGFNKAHAVAYAWIAYQTAYLKTNHPVPFFAALLDSVADNPEKAILYLRECRLKKITLLAPNVNASSAHFSPESNAIRFGLRGIRGMGEAGVRALLDARRRGGPFTSLDNLTQRAGDDLTKKSLELLIRCGACDDFGERELLLAHLDGSVARGRILANDDATGQQSLFMVPTTPLDRVCPVDSRTRMAWERELLGLSLNGHPADAVAHRLRALRATPIADAIERPGLRRVGGVLSGVRRFRSKRGPMLTATLEDPSGSVRVVLFPRRYEALHAAFRDDAAVLLDGRLKAPGRATDDQGGLDLAVDQAIPLDGEQARSA